VCSICVYSSGKQRQTAANNGTQKQKQLVDFFELSGENREKPQSSWSDFKSLASMGSRWHPLLSFGRAKWYIN
jgi:hypothetical protein